MGMRKKMTDIDRVQRSKMFYVTLGESMFYTQAKCVALSISMCFCGWCWTHLCGCASISPTAYGSDILYAPFSIQTSQLLWCQSICVERKDFPLRRTAAYSILIRIVKFHRNIWPINSKPGQTLVKIMATGLSF